MKENRVLLLNGLILIIVSLIGYFVSPVKSPTAFIGAAFGLVFIFLSFPVKAENSTAAHIAVALMLIAAIAFSITAYTRNNVYILVMAIASVISLLLLIAGFFRRKKQRQSLNN